MISDQQKDALFVQIGQTLTKADIDPVTALEVLAGLMAALIAHMEGNEARQRLMCEDMTKSMLKRIKKNSIRH